MTKTKAENIQLQIEEILKSNDIHYKTEIVRSPNLKFINIMISIKVTN